MNCRVLSAAAAAVLLVACGGEGGSAGPDASPPDAAWGPVSAAIAPDMLLAADPKLTGFDGWPLRFTVDSGGRPATGFDIVIERGGTQIAALTGTPEGTNVYTATWNGLAADGSFLTPGIVTAHGTVTTVDGTTATVDANLEIVRLGIVEIGMGGAARATLMYGEMDGMAGAFYVVPNDRAPWRIGPDATEVGGAVRLEMADGSARPLPAIWSDLDSPPLDNASPDGAEQDSYNLPTAWVAGGQVDFTVRFSSDVAGMPGGGAPQQSTIR